MRPPRAVLPLVVVLLGACGFPASPQIASAARTEPTTSAPTSGAPPYAVLVDELVKGGSTYDISAVAIDGKVVARQAATKRTAPITAYGAALDLPVVSTTSTSLYYLDGDAGVLRLSIGATAARSTPVTTLDVGRGMEGTFAVSPDDTKIAVSVLDFTTTPVHLKLYIDNLTGGNKHVIFESDSNYVWPVAWHGGLLVLAHAYAPFLADALKAAPARDNPYWAVSYHVVDPLTANRVVLMGACTVSGPLSPAGSACIQGGSIDWHGNTTDWSTRDWGSISAAGSISPDGSMVAAADPDQPGRLDFWRQGGAIATWVDGPGAQEWAGWLDNTHVVIASMTMPGYRTRILDLTAGPKPAVFIDASGFYAARLPTDII